jgi:hypothetical protein
VADEPSTDIKTETIVLGPDYAEHLLRRNTRNRPINHARVARYARAMKKGNWKFTGDAIQIAHDGTVLNGQKRLHAVVISETSIQVNLVSGLPLEAQRYMDQGQVRSAGNQLSIEGTFNAHAAAAIARLHLTWEAGEIVSYAKSIAAPLDEIVEFALKNADELQHAIILADRVRKNIPVSTASVGAVAYRAWQLDSEAADQFFDELAHGANLDLGSPILTFRNHVVKLHNLRIRRSNVEIVYLLVIAWNAWRAGRTDMYRIQLPKGGVTDVKFPEML